MFDAHKYVKITKYNNNSKCGYQCFGEKTTSIYMTINSFKERDGSEIIVNFSAFKIHDM
jgi:hypothetical protein